MFAYVACLAYFVYFCICCTFAYFVCFHLFLQSFHILYMLHMLHILHMFKITYIYIYPPLGRKDAKSIILHPLLASRPRFADWGFVGVVRQPLTAPRPRETRRLSTPPNSERGVRHTAGMPSEPVCRMLAKLGSSVTQKAHKR